MSILSDSKGSGANSGPALSIDLLAGVARHAAEQFRRRVKGLGLTGAQARILYHLGRADRPTQAWLADQLAINPVSVGEQIDKLAAAGFICRAPNLEDKRSVLLQPTAAGRKAVVAVTAIGRQIDHEMLVCLSPGQGTMLRECLKIVHENAGL